MNLERVELHAHTKMGEMDGTIGPGELVKRAFEMGHSGVAVTDNCSVQGYIDAWRQLKFIRESGGKDFKLIYGMEAFIADEDNQSYESACKVTILVQNDIGRVTLYWLLSEALLTSHDRVPVISKQLLYENKEGLLIGSCGTGGELYQAVAAGDNEYWKKSAGYDYLEIFTGNPGDAEHERINKCIAELGKRTGKHVIASSDVRYMDQSDELGYRVLRWLDGEDGKEYHNHFMGTDEMLTSFAYLGEKLAEETVIFAPQQILSMISDIEPLREGIYLPQITGSDFIISNSCEETLRDIYGDDIPASVMKRYQSELKIILEKGYDFHYITAMRLVKKCRQDGFPVSSRGAAGASFISYLLGITEVNPLPDEFGGYNLPFETIHGLDGDKFPDFDLNFAPEYFETIANYLKTLYGEHNVIRAGTISTISERLAEAYVNEYLDGNNMLTVDDDTRRSLAGSLSGVKRGVGLHSGGFLVVPSGEDIYSFTPQQRFMNRENGEIVSHFSFHALSCNLEKIDLLSYDGLSILKNLSDITGVSLYDIATDDVEIMKLFKSPEVLGITSDDIGGFPLGTLGILEFQNQFAADVVMKTSPGNFRELAKISAICHGTGTWIDNSEILISEGKTGLNEIIGAREEIMNLLLDKGMKREDAYYVMESVRKGKAGSKASSRWQEYRKKMEKIGLPGWYLESCEKIKYLFPMAHALSYTLMSWRLAYYKLHYPKEFYQSYFKVKADDDTMQVIRKGKTAVAEKIDELQSKPTETDDWFYMDSALDILAVAREMYARGIRI